MRATIVPLTLREANDFVERHHRHSARTSNDGGKFAIGLHVDGQLVGAAIVGRPVARMLQSHGTAELLRCCVGPGAPDGAGKALNSRCKRIWQLMGGLRLVTYTLATETGGSLSGAGFVKEAEVKGRQWNGSKLGGRPIASEPKVRWAADLPDHNILITAGYGQLGSTLRAVDQGGDGSRSGNGGARAARRVRGGGTAGYGQLDGDAKALK